MKWWLVRSGTDNATSHNISAWMTNTQRTIAFLVALQRTVQAHQQLRGVQYEEGHVVDRQLQEYNISIPLLPIILIIVCCCLCMRKQEEQRNGQVVARTPAAAVTANPQLVTAAASKFSSQATVGVSFKGGDHAMISTIKSDSLFAGSAIASGMKVVSINNVMVASATEARQVIEESSKTVTILAHSPGYFGQTENLVAATATKELPDQSLGVSFKTNGAKVELTGIKENSLFDSADLAPGMQVVAINNVTVQSGTHAVSLTQHAFPLVTILARRTAAVAVAVEEVPVQATVVLVENESQTAEL